MRLSPLLLVLSAVTTAQSQIRLPTLPVLPLTSVGTLADHTGTEGLGALSDVRQLEIKRLLQINRHVLETDPQGNAIVRREVLAVGASDDALAEAQSLGFVIARDQLIASPNVRLLTLTVPPQMDTQKALRQLRERDPAGLYDFNHLYSESGAAVMAARADAQSGTVAGVALPSPGARIRVGLVDTGVDTTHPSFKAVEMHTFGCDRGPVANAHGTAVASIVVAHASAALYAADVYCGLPTGGAVDAVVGALAWMADEHVAVINVSLVGPKNVLLEYEVRSLIERGHLIVAAVGNDGPAAPPLYPAAYEKVIGVTAVDAHRRVLLEAERGPQVMFAARGADLAAAGMDHRDVEVRGTSFASPTVAALLAAHLSMPDREAALAAVDALAQQAVHLGARGKDLTYGWGLVGTENF